MLIIDTHCHVNDDKFINDRDAVIQRAIDNNIAYMIVVGCDTEGAKQAIALAEQYSQIYAAVAWHPVDVIDCTEDDKAFLLSVFEHQKVVAVGETGLDYYWDKSPKELQKEYFLWHIEQSVKNNKPFIVHNRDAHHDTLEILQACYQKYGMLNGIMHSYSGSVEMAQEFLKLGLHLSISGVVTFKNAKNVKEVAKIIPDDKLLVETDSPYLTPEPYRGTRNEPLYVKRVVDELAILRNTSIDQIALITTQNAKKLFKLPQ